MTKYVLAAVLLTYISCTKTKEDYDAISEHDFVLQASVVNATEIELANVAASKGTDEGVKALAQSIMTYHNQVQMQLRSLAIDFNLVAPDSVDAEHLMLRNQLLDLSGRAFDSVYIHSRVQDYTQATKLFFQEIISGQNVQLRDYSSSVLPQLEMYLHQADSLVNKY